MTVPDGIAATAKSFASDELIRVSQLAALQGWVSTHAGSFEEAVTLCTRDLELPVERAEALARWAGFRSKETA